MQLANNPRPITAAEGLRWLPEGIRLLRRRPLAWFTALMVYWAVISFLGLIPIAGMVISLLMAPALALGFVALAEAVDRADPAADMPLGPRVDLMFVGLRGEARGPMLRLGLVYAVAIALLVALVGLVASPESTGAAETAGSAASPESVGSLGFGTGQLLWGMALYIPILMAFWFSPQLVVWKGYGIGKAIFFSFFAVWLNRGAFLLYGASWVGLGLIFAMILGMILSVFPAATPGQLILAVLPASLLLMAVGHGSVYASTVALFAETSAEVGGD